MICYLYL